MESRSPHDHLFKKSMEIRAVAKDFFRAHLPVEIQKQLDFRTLKLTDKSFVTDKYKDLHSDLIYQCRIGQEANAYLYLVVEHQSTEDKMMAYRIYEYNNALMSKHLAQGNTGLPIILNVCVYHGKGRYISSTDFDGLL